MRCRAVCPGDEVVGRAYPSDSLLLNYPYFRLWMDLLLPWRRQNLLKRYVPQCQVLFIYGGNKPLMFHSERWLHTLKRTGGRHECIEDGDHWFMESHPQIVNGFIHEWLSEARSDVVHPE